jgi:hypothetical protein
MIYDNYVFTSIDSEGNFIPAQKLPRSSKYHVAGDLVMPDRDYFKKLFNKSVPMLRAGGDAKKLILSPLLRYIHAPCCDDSTHLTNYGKYAAAMGSGLADIKQWLKDLVFGKRIRNFRVMCSNSAIGLDEEDDVISKRQAKALYGKDPVHLSPVGYKKPASQREKATSSATSSGLMRTLQAAGQPPPGKEPDGWRTTRSQFSVLALEIEAEDTTLGVNPPQRPLRPWRPVRKPRGLECYTLLKVLSNEN